MARFAGVVIAVVVDGEAVARNGEGVVISKWRGCCGVRWRLLL